MPEILSRFSRAKKTLALSATIVLSSLGVTSGSAQERMPRVVTAEDTATLGCDRLVIIDALGNELYHGPQRVSHGKMESMMLPNGDAVVVSGSANQKLDSITILTASANDQFDEHTFKTKDIIPFGGGVEVVQAGDLTQENPNIVVSATFDRTKYDGSSNVSNPCNTDGYSVTFYKNFIDQATGTNVLQETGSIDTESLLISQMIADANTGQIIALAQDKKGADGLVCNDGSYLITYDVQNDNGTYSLKELRRSAITVPDVVKGIAAERVSAISRLTQDTVAFVNGSDFVTLVSLVDGNNIQVPVEGFTGIRGMDIDTDTGMIVLSTAKQIITAKLIDNKLVVIDSIDSVQNGPYGETLGSIALAIKNGYIVAPADEIYADLALIKYDKNGKIISRVVYTICYDPREKTDANILVDAEIIDRSASVPTSTPQPTSTPVPTNTTVPSATSMPTSTRIIEVTPTVKPNVTVWPTLATRATNTPTTAPTRRPTTPRPTASPTHRPKASPTHRPTMPAKHERLFLPLTRKGRR